MTFRPRPVQRPRVPVWVVGAWPHERSMRRAIRWDGVVVQGMDEDGQPSGMPTDIAAIVAWVRQERVADGREAPFEIVASGTTPAGDPNVASAVARRAMEAGATWWVEADWTDMSVVALRARILAGPPGSEGGVGPG